MIKKKTEIKVDTITDEKISNLLKQKKVNSEFSSYVPLNHKEIDREVNKIVKELSKQNPKLLPDAYLHQKISFIKSGIRVLGYIFLPFSLEWAVALLILSEVIGIIEELV
mgnify:CR=1 FL=1